MTQGLNDAVTSADNTISGTLNKNAAVTITLNDAKVVDAQSMTAGQAINQSLTFVPGRNSVVITASDTTGNTDTIAYNVIYLTNYNAVVDSASTLTNGTLVNNVKTYKTIQAAVNDVPKTNTSSYIIFIKNGTYNENVQITSGANFISLIGESRAGTKITSNKDLATYTRQLCATVYVKSDDFTAENITFENTYAFNFTAPLPSDMRALALDVESKRAVFQNCNINARQDTLYVDTNSGETGRQYYKNCYISGDVDFIYGPSVAVFDDCDIYSLDRFTNPNGYVTAANTPAYRQYGLVFLNSRLTSNAGAGTVYLGRPWGQDATVAYLNCYLGAHINADGWTSMGTYTPDLAHFAEYKNYGPGAVVNASRKQLTDAEAANYTISNILSVGDGWDPAAYINKLYNPESSGSGSSTTGSNTVLLTEVLNGKTVASGIQSSLNSGFTLPAVILADGLNTITVTAKDSNNLTRTKTINVTYNKNAPVITLTSAPGQVILADTSVVAGTVNKDSDVTVKLNGNSVYSQQKAANESFSADLKLNEGTNTLEIAAVDQYGISSVISYTVNYVKDWGTNEFTASSVIVTNAGGTPVSALYQGRDVNVTASYTNNSDIQKNATLVIALIDGNGNMIDASYSVDGFNAKEAKALTARFKIPNYTFGCKIKVFVWDNSTDRKLLSNEIVLP
jgi:Pectin methylesterase